MTQAAQAQETNFEYVERIRKENDFTYKQLAKLSSYSRETVRAWFAPHGSSKFREVPDRAVRLLKFELQGKEK